MSAVPASAAAAAAAPGPPPPPEWDGPPPRLDAQIAGLEAAGERARLRGARRTALLLVITISLVLSVYWAADSWSKIGGGAEAWGEARCTVLGAGVERGEKVGTLAAFWRSRFVVEFEAGGAGERGKKWSGLVAWRYGSGAFNVSEDAARAYSGRFGDGDVRPCYLLRDGREGDEGEEAVPGNEGWRVSMSPVAAKTSPDIDVALASTFLCGLLLVCFLLALIFAVGTMEPLEPMRGHEHTGTMQPNALSNAQVTRICAVAAEAAAGEEAAGGRLERSGWDCAICLDHEGGEGGRLARMPCWHLFHLFCVKGWLMRGGVTCPLCNLRLQPVDEDAYANAKSEALAGEDRVDSAAGVADSGIAGTLATLPDFALAMMGLTSPPEPAFRHNMCAQLNTSSRSAPTSRTASSSSRNDAVGGHDSAESRAEDLESCTAQRGSTRVRKQAPGTCPDGTADAYARLAQARRRHSNVNCVRQPQLQGGEASLATVDTVDALADRPAARGDSSTDSIAPPCEVGAASAGDDSHNCDVARDKEDLQSSGVFGWPTPIAPRLLSDKRSSY